MSPFRSRLFERLWLLHEPPKRCVGFVNNCHMYWVRSSKDVLLIFITHPGNLSFPPQALQQELNEAHTAALTASQSVSALKTSPGVAEAVAGGHLTGGALLGQVGRLSPTLITFSISGPAVSDEFRRQREADDGFFKEKARSVK
jgi:hypothetical protein